MILEDLFGQAFVLRCAWSMASKPTGCCLPRAIPCFGRG